MLRFPEIGRYQLLKRLAVGGMGEVYLARQRSSVEGFVRLFAIKVLLPSYSTNASFVNMFLDEARVAAKLHHKNIVQMVDIDQHEGQYYIVMEYIAGQNLRELVGDRSIAGQSLFEPRLGAEIFGEIAGALAAVHAARLIHRDISPNNIMVSDTGVPKLIDFGVARASSSASLTTPGTLKGKFGYMAPEYVRGHDYDHRADLFSLGVVMWETFCRKRLFRGTSAAEQLHRLLDTEIPRVDQVVLNFPADLTELISIALDRDPNARFPTATALANSLAQVANHLPVVTDSTLAGWLERRLAARIAERKRSDEAFLSTPSDAELLAFEEPLLSAGMSAGSIPGTYGGGSPPKDVPTRMFASGRMNNEFAQNPNETAGTSVLQGVGEIHKTPAVAPSGSAARWIVGVVALIAAIAAIAIWLQVRTSSPTPSATPTIAAIRSSTATATAIELAEAHRRIGLQALADKDFARARLEFTEAMNSGGASSDLSQLLKLATELDRVAAPEVASVPLPPPTAPPIPLIESPTKKEPPTRKEPPKEPPKTAHVVRRTERIEPKRPKPEKQEPDVVPPSPEPSKTPSSEPPPTIDEKLGVGDLIATSTPPGIAVRVDGKQAGQTPLRVPLASGPHQVSFVQDARVVHTEMTTIRDKDQTFVDFDLPTPPLATAPPAPTPIPTPVPPARPTIADVGELEIHSPNVVGEVFINGVSRGYAPIVVKNVVVGGAQIEIRVGGTVRRSKVVKVESGRRVTIRFD